MQPRNKQLGDPSLTQLISGSLIHLWDRSLSSRWPDLVWEEEVAASEFLEEEELSDFHLRHLSPDLKKENQNCAPAVKYSHERL